MKVTKSKRLMFSVALAFVSVFFIAYAIAAFYPAPQYEDFCEEKLFDVVIPTEADCENIGGKWNFYENDTEGYCDIYGECNEEYDEVRDPYEKNVFFINVVLGVVLFLVAFFLGLEAVSSGLMGGAVLLIIYGCVRYWGELSDIWRTLILGLALVILIVLGYRKLRD